MAGVDCDIQRAILDQRQHLFCLVELLQSRLQAATLAGTVGIEAHLVAQEAPLGFQDQGYVACFADFADRSEKLFLPVRVVRSEEHTSELQSLMRISYAVFCLKKKNNQTTESIYT